MLHERITCLKEGSLNKGPILYWMSREQRIKDNWAFIYAQEMALDRQSPLAVAFCITPRFLGATNRQYTFMLDGLKEVAEGMKSLSVPFFLLRGDPAIDIPAFIVDHDIAALVTDFDPLRIKREWKTKIAQSISIPFYEVDAHNITPCMVASQKAEYGAYTIRKKIQRVLPLFMDDFPSIKKHPFPWKRKIDDINWDRIMDRLDIDKGVTETGWIIPGEAAAHKALKDFMTTGLEEYEKNRNDPSKHGQSGLSPYIHFGQLSAQRIALEVTKSIIPLHLKKSFLEELIVRRELSDNFCFYNKDYDNVGGFPEWAKKTFDRHREDRRTYLYSIEKLERAATHDRLWNAAQMEMVKRGKMHGYMRMYWAKKILEWTESPEEAMRAAIYLNDKYELDGRDPNGYAGIAWSIGGVHDRAWNERYIFGKIRYMSYNGCRSKFNIEDYIGQIEAI